MTQIASSAGARGLLPSWSGGKEKTCDGDDGLLRPMTQETTRSRWGSDSTEQGDQIGSVRQQEICSMGDLEQVKNRRKQGEEYLRSALSSIGTLATDITRRLDYTYYNLLEKITALNSTISSFQELSDSTSALFDGFEREVTGLDQEIRKQIGELKGFQPQIQKIESLEEQFAEPVPELDGQGDNHLWSRHSSGLADHHTSRRFTSSANTPTSKGRNTKASPTDSDPLWLFDEL
ncbi:hypothetical protein MW887_003707 [Aspergillus wentii]|nr:hypothetical protein MW887_003707 [Aspergillus wentii]